MTVWYTFVCEHCGYGGLTDDRFIYEQGQKVCPECGRNRFTLEEPDTVGYPDPDERAVGGLGLD